MSKTPNGYSESVESLFMDRNGLPDNHYLSPLRALDNPTPGTIKKWLTRPERSSDQSLSCSGLQVQEIRLLSDEESVNWLTGRGHYCNGSSACLYVKVFFLLFFCWYIVIEIKILNFGNCFESSKSLEHADQKRLWRLHEGKQSYMHCSMYMDAFKRRECRYIIPSGKEC